MPVFGREGRIPASGISVFVNSKISVFVLLSVSVSSMYVSSVTVSVSASVRDRDGTMSVFNSIQFDSIRFDSIRFDSIRFESIQFNPIQSNPIQFNSIQFDSIRFYSIRFNSVQNDDLEIAVDRKKLSQERCTFTIVIIIEIAGLLVAFIQNSLPIISWNPWRNFIGLCRKCLCLTIL